MRAERLLHHRRLLARAVRVVLVRAGPYAAVTLAVVALLLGGSRLLLGYFLENHPAVVAGWMSRTIGHPVRIGALATYWQGWAPGLVAEEFTVLGEDREPALRLRRIDLEIDPLGTLLAGAIRVGAVRVDGLALALVRAEDGTVALRGFRDTAASVDLLPVLLTARAPVELARSTLVWEDRGRGHAPVALGDLTLTLRGSGERHHLEVAAALPGGRVRLVAETRGDLLAGAWDGTTYLEVQGLSLARWVSALAPGSLAPRSGAADLALWVHWQAGRVQRLIGDLDARSTILDLGDVPVNIAAAHTRFASRRLGDGWHLALADLLVQSDLGRVEAAECELKTGAQPAASPWLVRVGQLGLHPPEPGSPVSAGAPLQARASLRELWLAYDPRQAGLASVRLSGSIDRLDLQDPGGGLELQGLAGRISAHGQRGRVELDTGPVGLDLPRAFAQPLAFTAVAGTVDWQLGQGRWLLSSSGLEFENTDLRLTLAGRLGARTAGDPDRYLSLRAHLDRLDLRALPRYLPERVMKRRAHAWLVGALRRGQVTSLDLLLHGPLAEFPFHRASGTFEATAELEGVELDYRPPWPAVTDARATLRFQGPGLTIAVASARMLDSPIGATVAEIAALAHEFPVLTVRGGATPSGADALRVVREGPLEPAVKRRFDGIEIEGELGLTLELTVPLARDDLRVTQVDGQVAFRGNTVRLRGVELSGAEGRLGFTRDGLVSERLRASLAGLPLGIGIEADTVEGRGVTRLRLDGTASATQLAGALAGRGGGAVGWRTLAGRLRGSFDWQGTATLPGEAAGSAQAASVILSSDLRGLAVELPPPLAKDAGQRRLFELETTLDGETGRVLKLRYGEEVAAAVALGAEAGEARVSGAHVRLGPGARPPAATPGRMSVVGTLDTLALAAWGGLLGTFEDAIRPARPGGGRALPVHVELSAGRVELGSHGLEGVAVTADLEPRTGWAVRLEGDGASGRVRVAPPGTGEGVVVELDRLALVPVEGAVVGAKPADPRALPPVHFSCADLSLAGRSLGALSFSARPTGTGLNVPDLRLQGPLLEAEARGHWDWNGGDQRSRFETSLSTPDLGKLVVALGYDDTGIEGGRSEISGAASWPGPPTAFALARASGQIQLKVENGMLNEVKPGAAGRIFGLLSVQALPRRLSLDFRDLFGKGLRYERIVGSFTIAAGNAHTEDLVVEADAARIEVSGRVGLAAQDYDQVVTVTPRVSTTLPVAGAIAGGPAGAVVGLLAQGLLRDQIDRAAASRYAVTGSWEDPQVTRLPAAGPTPEP